MVHGEVTLTRTVRQHHGSCPILRRTEVGKQEHETLMHGNSIDPTKLASQVLERASLGRT